MRIFITLGVNVLLLDEPTNHLDIEAVTALKEMLKKYTGIVLLVSHNRWFLKGLEIGSCYEVTDGTVQKIDNIDHYIQAAQARAEGMMKRLKRAIKQ